MKKTRIPQAPILPHLQVRQFGTVFSRLILVTQQTQRLYPLEDTQPGSCHELLTTTRHHRPFPSRLTNRVRAHSPMYSLMISPTGTYPMMSQSRTHKLPVVLRISIMISYPTVSRTHKLVVVLWPPLWLPHHCKSFLKYFNITLI
jgi:hypothetical protein